MVAESIFTHFVWGLTGAASGVTATLLLLRRWVAARRAEFDERERNVAEAEAYVLTARDKLAPFAKSSNR